MGSHCSTVEQRGFTAEHLNWRSGGGCRGICPRTSCADGTLRLRKGEGLPELTQLGSAGLDVSSTVRPFPSLPRQRGSEGNGTLHLQKVLTGHISVLRAEMGDVGDVGPVLYPGHHFAGSVAGQIGGTGAPQDPILTYYWTLEEVQGTDPPPFLPSLAQPVCMAERRTPMGRCGTQPSAPLDPCPASCAPVRTAAKTASG